MRNHPQLLLHSRGMWIHSRWLNNAKPCCHLRLLQIRTLAIRDTPPFSLRMKSWIPDCGAQQAQPPFPVTAPPVEAVEVVMEDAPHQQLPAAVEARPTMQVLGVVATQTGY